MLPSKDHYKKKPSSFEKVGNILDAALKNIGLDFKLKQYKAMTHWDEIVGEQIAQVSRPQHFKFKVLFVNVNNPVWLHQLSFLEDKMVSKINKYIQLNVVDRIYFRAGSITGFDSLPEK